MIKFMKVQFNASLDNVTLARSIAACFLLECNLTVAVLNEVKTIVSEAVTNAIVHGYRCDNESLVSMELELEDGILRITVEDKGVGIENVEEARTPLFSTKLKEERAGLGFTIMEVFSDEMSVNSKPNEGTTVFCVKKIA